MKIFLSWSGPLSRSVAEALRDWLPSVLQSVKPYVSSQDITKGARWSVDIACELETSNYGIICVTPGNIERPWLNFEAGALARSFEEGLISPFLFGVDRPPTDGPLAQFQATLYERVDVLALVRSINRHTKVPLEAQLLDRVFGKLWPSLKEALDPLLASAAAESESTKHIADEKINELLELARRQARELETAPRVAARRSRGRLASTNTVDTDEVTSLLARLRAGLSTIPLHKAETPFMVQTKARITLLTEALSPMLDTETLDTLTRLYTEQTKASPVSRPA